MAFPRWVRLLPAAAAFACMAGLSAYSAGRAPPPSRQIAEAAGWLDEAGLVRLLAMMPPGAPQLARRFEPDRGADLWDRPPAWPRLVLDAAPVLPLKALNQAQAQTLNAVLPAEAAERAIGPPPFVLRATKAEHARAVQCLAQAIYYEAALEPLAGQRAVAQTVLNRVRHPDFPKSICGVVYQGASAPGCQFSFACDGSMARPPIAPYWQQAKAVAEAALSGYVEGEVGPATYYHADYVFPRWEPEMVKVGQVGTHIFYRYAGPMGTLEALCGRYEGRELKTPIPKPPKLVVAATEPPPPPGLAPATDADGRKVGRLNVEAHPHMPDEREYVSVGPPQRSPPTSPDLPTITPPR